MFTNRTPCALIGLIACALLALSAPATAQEGPKDGRDADTFRGLAFRSMGPSIMSGRIAEIAIHPYDRSTWYVGVGSGGVWKTDDNGTTWQSLFDGQGSYSIGVVTIDPSDPDVIWVGTGENVSGRHVGFGDGVYRSRDGGKSWQNMGLTASEHIGRILVDPRDSKVVLVAAEGPLWSSGGERGVYRTADGG
ncbi:MAG: glycosyl hydrolase, partial [Gemmatimonadota bacterium]